MIRKWFFRTAPWVLALVIPAAWALKDPTRPPDARSGAVQAQPQRDLQLGSIMLGDRRRVVVIDGVAMAEGDSLDNIRVRRIHKDRVEITDNGRPRVLYPEPLPQVRTNP